MFQKFYKSLRSNDLEKIFVSLRLLLNEQRLQRSDLAEIKKMIISGEIDAKIEEEQVDSSGGE